MSEQPIRVLIADDHELVRAGIQFSLETNLPLVFVAHASDGAEAVALFRSFHPDVILMDIKMPHVDGIAATAAIHAIDPRARIIMLTNSEDSQTIREALRAGAVGYQLKNSSGRELAAAVQSAYYGQSPLCNEAVEALTHLNQPGNSKPALTPREMDVLALIVQGCSNREIAVRLHVSESTAKKHVSSIIEKLGAANRAEVVALALQTGIIKASSPSANRRISL